jgi:hypothetical protein
MTAMPRSRRCSRRDAAGRCSPGRGWIDQLDAAPGRRALLDALAGAVSLWRGRRLHPDFLWHDPRVALVKRSGRSRLYTLNAHEVLFLRRCTRRRCHHRGRLVRRLVVALIALAAISSLSLWRWWCASIAAPEPPRCEHLLADEPADDEPGDGPDGAPYGTSL